MGGAVSKEEEAFIAWSAAIARRYGVELWYDMLSAYSLHHILPLFHALPGKLLKRLHIDSGCSRSFSHDRFLEAIDEHGFAPTDVVWANAQGLNSFFQSGHRHQVIVLEGSIYEDNVVFSPD